MERETNWVGWKREGCLPFERPAEARVPSAAAETGTAVNGAAAAAAAMRGGPAAVAGVKRRRGGGGAASKPTFAALIAEPEDQMAGLRASERRLMPELRVGGRGGQMAGLRDA